MFSRYLIHVCIDILSICTCISLILETRNTRYWEITLWIMKWYCDKHKFPYKWKICPLYSKKLVAEMGYRILLSLCAVFGSSCLSIFTFFLSQSFLLYIPDLSFPLLLSCLICLCSDDVMDRELHDRISFRSFLHYPKIIPDSRTIWLFRERLSTMGKDKVIRNAIWKQFEDRGIPIKKGMV